jgi:hypothetical protein
MRSRAANLLFGEVAHRRVREHSCAAASSLRAWRQRVLLDHRPELGVFARQLAVLVHDRP